MQAYQKRDYKLDGILLVNFKLYNYTTFQSSYQPKITFFHGINEDVPAKPFHNKGSNQVYPRQV